MQPRRITDLPEAYRERFTYMRTDAGFREPADNHRIVQDYADWLAESSVPKLFINTTDGHALIGRNRDFCRTWPNQTEVTVRGRHYYQEDSPHEVGQAIAAWIDALPA